MKYHKKGVTQLQQGQFLDLLYEILISDFRINCLSLSQAKNGWEIFAQKKSIDGNPKEKPRGVFQTLSNIYDRPFWWK